MGENGARGPERGRVAAAISNAISRIHREHYGRGASRARTVMGADYIICFLEDIYTPVERTLIEGGRFEAVRETRDAFQDTMQKTFTAAVEELSGRRVIGFLSQVHVDPDLAVETFILEPENDGQPVVGESSEGEQPDQPES